MSVNILTVRNCANNYIRVPSLAENLSVLHTACLVLPLLIHRQYRWIDNVQYPMVVLSWHIGAGGFLRVWPSSLSRTPKCESLAIRRVLDNIIGIITSNIHRYLMAPKVNIRFR